MEFTRRSFLKTSFALGLAAMLPGAALAALPDPSRSLHFYNTHTGESLKRVYWEQGAYDPRALSEIAHVLRDFRTGDVHPMDANLLDLLATLHRRLDSSKPFEVISGYRSPHTNAMLHEHTGGVAVKSQHMLGKAIDIRLTDRRLAALRDTAIAMNRGGVGYYPDSDFVHVDTGNVRRW